RRDERGEALRDRAGAGGRDAGAAPLRRARVRGRPAARAALPRRDRAHDLRGHERDPARRARARALGQGRRGAPRGGAASGGEAMTADSPYWNPKTETLPREDLQRLQAKKLRALVERAYANSPFHRRMLDAAKVKPERIRKIEDLKRIPFTTRAAWMECQE